MDVIPVIRTKIWGAVLLDLAKQFGVPTVQLTQLQTLVKNFTGTVAHPGKRIRNGWAVRDDKNNVAWHNGDMLAYSEAEWLARLQYEQDVLAEYQAEKASLPVKDVPDADTLALWQAQYDPAPIDFKIDEKIAVVAELEAI